MTALLYPGVSHRQPAHPRALPQPQPEASPQEPEEEILGSDDEEQEDPNDYCKGTPPFLSTPSPLSLTRPDA